MCDAASMRFRIASIDLGTVSSRLLLATVEDGVIVDSNKHTVITNLGEGVDATGSLCNAAIERVTSAASFVAKWMRLSLMPCVLR